MNKLIIIGAGGHAKSSLDVIHSEKKFRVVGFVDNAYKQGDTFCSYKILGNDNDLDQLVNLAKNAFIAIGQISNPDIRNNLYIRLRDIGFKLPSILSPNASISIDSFIHEGTIVMNGACVNSGAKIGSNCIINTGAIIEHDAIIGDNCHISTNAVVNGSCSVGNSSFIGSGSILRNNISIGSKCFVGMGSRVLKDLPDNTQYRDHE